MSNESERLVKEYFWFLVDNHGLTYRNGDFQSPKMLIKILLGHKTPRIDFIKIGDDPNLFRLDFEWVIKFFRGTFPSEQHDYLKYNLEKNVIYLTQIFREYSSKLIDDFDDWWLPVHVFYYRTIEEEYRSKGQTNIFQKAYKYYYEYLKNEGVI